MCGIFGCCAASAASEVACTIGSCCIGIGCRCCCAAAPARKSTVTRFCYLLIFGLSLVLAWVLLVYGGEIVGRLPTFNGLAATLIHVPDTVTQTLTNIQGTSAVYRLCFALAVFHAVQAVLLIGVKSSQDPRSVLQDGLWCMKVLVYIGMVIGFFFLPNESLRTVGWIGFVGATLFILIQLVILNQFAHSANEHMYQKWANSEDEDNTWRNLLILSTFVLFGFAFALSISMWVLYCKGEGCSLNILFVTLNFVFMVINSCISVSPIVRGDGGADAPSKLMQAGIVCAYSTYLVFSALMSETNTWACAAMPPPAIGEQMTRMQVAAMVLGSLFSILSVIYTALNISTTSDEEFLGKDKTQPLLEEGKASDAPEKDEDDGDDEKSTTRYSYFRFHLTFSTAALYMMMLLTNWVVFGVTDGSASVDTGSASVWIKVVTSWLTHLIFLWTLVAPRCFPDRDFS